MYLSFVPSTAIWGSERLLKHVVNTFFHTRHENAAMIKLLGRLKFAVSISRPRHYSHCEDAQGRWSRKMEVLFLLQQVKMSAVKEKKKTKTSS